MARKRTRTARPTQYIQLTNSFTPQPLWSEDRIARLHEASLEVLRENGIRVLLPEAREIFARAGARVVEDMVFIGPEIVGEALRTAPRQWRLLASNPERSRDYAPGQILFGPGAGCPNVTDRQRGRRPGSLESFTETLRLHQAFDVIHILGPSAEPQDVPVALRHYATTEAQLTLSDKPLFVYSRGPGQVADSLEMIQLGLNLSEVDWAAGSWCYTVINSNSPRMLDRPMAQGIIDFARAGQMSVITPFCLAGAMAPVTVAGALVLQHAEALAGITLAQMTKPGAPVSYGGFSSNVDMKSGAPAFGTPEHLKMQLGSGQLARHIGFPWRSASGSASNTTDAQGAQENDHALWGAVLAQATMVLHAAGWLEGGLTFGYEKFINDVESLQTLAEMFTATSAAEPELALDAIAEVQPGGHFFAAAHTMERYEGAFYAPLVADLNNHGTWTAGGALTSEQRATAIWQRILADSQPLPQAAEIADRLAPFIARRKAEGGAPPME